MSIKPFRLSEELQIFENVNTTCHPCKRHEISAISTAIGLAYKRQHHLFCKIVDLAMDFIELES
jgi:hypothetical protein